MPDSTNAHCRDLLPWYAVGMLSPAESETVSHHLAACASCRQELSQWQEIGEATQQTLQQARPDQDNAASWLRLQSSLSADQPLNGKHTTIRGDRYMEFEQQTAPDVATASHRSARRPILALVAVSLVVILSVVGFVLFTPQHRSGNVAQPSNPTATLAPATYPTNASLVTPNPSAQTPLSPPITSLMANNVNGQLKIAGQTAVFLVGDTVNVSFKVQGTKANDTVSIKWYMSGADITPSLVQSNTMCCSKVMTDDKTTDVIFGLQVPSPGFGKAELYYNDTLAYTVVFDVVASK